MTQRRLKKTRRNETLDHQAKRRAGARRELRPSGWQYVRRQRRRIRRSDNRPHRNWNDGEKRVISLPCGPHIEQFRWQFDLFWYCHKRLYGQDAHRRAHAAVIKRNAPSEPKVEKLQWPTDMPHTLCEAFFDLGIASHNRLNVPFNLLAGLRQILPSIDDDTVVEVLESDMCHFRPAPVFEVNDHELIVCDLYESWHLQSKGANRHIVEPYFRNGGQYYNGGFVPIVGKAKTFKAILDRWTTAYAEIARRNHREDIHWWGRMYALQVACENARVQMIAKDLCHVPGANKLTKDQYIAHYSVDTAFDKRRYPAIDRLRFPQDPFHDAVGGWMDAQRTVQGSTEGHVMPSAPPTLASVPETHLGNSARTLWAGDRKVQIVLSMRNPRIVVLSGLVSDEECDALIALSKPRLERAVVESAGDGLHEVSTIRTSDGMFFAREENPLVARIERRVAALLNWPIENGEGLQVLRYEPGGEYKPHYDYFNPALRATAAQVKRGGNRVGTLLIYLNTPTQGGSTIFPDVELEVAPIKGNAVFFSYGRPDPDTRTLHGGAPVVEGEKWVATKWMRQGRFV